MAFLVNIPKEQIVDFFTEMSLLTPNKIIFLEIRYRSGE